ncbi:uncharacterized protein LOC117653640 [Thrips palmi]|uniref:Uncharacterized protein LOC117653640 n=1 Tax=Thrips palmi TaxID=161013 RepID=A0A6P9ACX2_THRPL|nr:uncharacterized protein LOC117653640 [Thrips palmi]
MAMEKDPFMKVHAQSGFFMMQREEATGLDVEIEQTTEFWQVDADNPILLMLHSSTQLEIPTRQLQVQTQAQAEPVALNSKDIKRSYLDRIGVRVHKDPGPGTPSAVEPAAVASTSGQQPKQQPKAHQLPKPAVVQAAPKSLRLQEERPEQASGSKRRRRSESPEGDYLEYVLKNREENANRLRQIIPEDAPKLRPATKRKQNKQGKENIERRVMPRRAAKDKAQSALDEDITEDNTNEEEVEMNPQPQVQGPLSKNVVKLVQVKVVGNFHKKKDHRPIGKIITKSTPLPPFTKELRQSLENGIYNTQYMNYFLKKHVENVTGGYYLKKSEYKILGQQVASRLKSMRVENPEGYIGKIKKELSNSLRSSRYYPKKKAARIAKKKALRAAQRKAGETVESSDEEGEGLLLEEQGEPDEAEIILQKPVVNRQSIKRCISESTYRIRFIKSNPVDVVLAKYPYLKEADLLIYEYSTRVPLPLTDLEANFNESLLPLSHILDIPNPGYDNELAKLQLYQKIEEFYSGGESHLPSIQFCEAANRNAVPLNEVPRGQAPALVVVQDGSKDLKSVSLIFDGGILTTLASNPSAFESIALLLAGYWVFDLQFPAPYKQHLESFEAVLHDRVADVSRSVSRYSKMDEFFRKLKLASNNSN